MITSFPPRVTFNMKINRSRALPGNTASRPAQRRGRGRRGGGGGTKPWGGVCLMRDWWSWGRGLLWRRRRGTVGPPELTLGMKNILMLRRTQTGWSLSLSEAGFPCCGWPWRWEARPLGSNSRHSGTSGGLRRHPETKHKLSSPPAPSHTQPS